MIPIQMFAERDKIWRFRGKTTDRKKLEKCDWSDYGFRFATKPEWEDDNTFVVFLRVK